MKKALQKITALLLVVVMSVFTFSACASVNVIIKFIVDGKSYGAVAVTNADDINLPTAPSKSGYTFDGWYLDQNVWEKPLNANAVKEKGEGILSVYAKFVGQTEVSFALSKTSVSLAVGDTYRITPTNMTGVNETDFTWSSNNSAVARVSGGTVTGVKEGTAVITATAKGVSKTCVVTVAQKSSEITGTFSLIVRYPSGTSVNGQTDGTGGSSGTEVQIVFYSSDKSRSYPAVTLDAFGEIKVSASAVCGALQDDTIIATVVGVPLGFKASDKTLTLTNRSGIISLSDTRSRLYVSNFSAGFGHVWLDKAIERFEKAYANVSFESGKTGVKVVADNNRNSAQTILNGFSNTPSEVFFMEGATYNDFVTRNVLLDISDVVKSNAPNDSVTIESKLTDEQKGFYSKSGKYYGLPHYAGYMGIIYDKDSFAQNGYYFAGDSAIIQGYNTLTSNDKYIFATSALQKKSNGPDGLPGTYDDGLPSTYDEFFALCDHIVSRNKKPITWNGIAPVNYLENLMQSLASTSDGKEQTMLNYEVWGTAETLGNYAMGGFVRDSEPTVIVGSTAKELARQKGKYDALSFMHKLIQAKAGIYYPSSAMGDPTYTQYDSQDDFLYGARNGGQYPMMIDGAWWQGEATESINKMVENYGNSYSKQNRNFGFMPYPKPDETYVGKDNVLYDHLTSLCCVKSGLTSAKQTMAKEFVRFMYSHESLFEFTKCTDVPKAVNYELSASEKNQLTPFAKSLCEVKEDSQIVYPISKSNLFVNVPTAFTSTSMFMGKMHGNNMGAINAIMAGANVNEFFASMYTYRQELTYNW